jgi:hypothetical protein
MRRQLIVTTALIALAAILVLGIPHSGASNARPTASPPRSTTARLCG